MRVIIDNKIDFMRDLSDGYGEGLTVLGLQQHEAVLQAQLQHFAGLLMGTGGAR
jgi:hypothetical protein